MYVSMEGGWGDRLEKALTTMKRIQGEKKIN
jgi:hypothetical protein